MLKKLIDEGEQIKQNNLKPSTIGSDYISGEEYEKWIAKCIIHLENNLGIYSSELVERFKKASEKAVGNSVSHFHTMMGILKAFEEMYGDHGDQE